MFIKIGERINSSRTAIARALEAKDASFIRKEARLQKEAGADMLDVNCAFNSENEIKDMEWLIDIVQDEAGLPLSIDSPDPEVVEAGLRKHKGKALINSITLDKKKTRAILPLVKKYDAQVIVLAMDENGMPSNAAERVEMAQRAIDAAGEFGIPREALFIDPLVRPVASEPAQASEALESVGIIKSKLKLKTICGLSNVSFGLPERSLLNSIFLAMMLGAGLSAAILDPINDKIKSAMIISNVLLGNDEFAREYIKTFRAGKLKF